MEVRFPIFGFQNVSTEESKSDGMIHKKHASCSENYEVAEEPELLEIIFPEDISVEDKFLLITCGLFLDYRFYEYNPNEVKVEASMEG